MFWQWVGNFTDTAVIIQALKMRESLDHLNGPKAITDVTLLVAEAGRRGNGDGREGHSQELKVLNAGIADGGGCEPSKVWAFTSGKGSQVFESLMVEKESLVCGLPAHWTQR